MKYWFALLVVLFTTAALGQDTTIRVLGVYPSHMSVGPGYMTEQLQAIRTAWSNSGLPASAATTVEILNGDAAFPIYYPLIPTNTVQASSEAPNNQKVKSMRAAWQADVIILFGNFGQAQNCGAARTAWGPSRTFIPNAQGLDLGLRNDAYVGVVNNGCENYIAAHEFGHLGGGGHATERQLYSDSRAYVELWGDIEFEYYFHTSVFDPIVDCPTLCNLPIIRIGAFRYSSPTPGYGDTNHNNVRALNTTARSLANYFETPPLPPVLLPPINLTGVYRGCVNGIDTRYDLSWLDHPETTAAVTHYEIWKSQPLGQPFVYGWTVPSSFSESYVSGVTGRARTKACSGSTCSNQSDSYFDAVPTCGG